MVTITGFKLHVSEEGEFYVRLQLSGGLQMIESKATGLIYATARKASIACTLSEEVAQAMIGTVLQGEIEKVDADPYQYEFDSGEVVELTHRWIFIPAIEGASVSEAA